MLFLAYLWGIETFYSTNWNDYFIIFVLSLPMRDWNISSSTSSLIIKSFLAYLWGIETEFYTVSHFFYIPFLAYLWGIETIKPYSSLIIVNYVLSLPMRDWNLLFLFLLILLPFAFLAYLWGIETSKFFRIWQVEHKFLAYLWGIETLLKALKMLQKMRS